MKRSGRTSFSFGGVVERLGPGALALRRDDGALCPSGGTRLKPVLLSLVASTLLVSGAAASESHNELFGVWRNPKDSVHVEIRPCGASACGYVVWAAAHAQADA